MAAEIKYVAQNNKLTIAMGQAVQMTGLVGADGYSEVPTPIWGYGTKELGVTRPGRTLEVNTAGDPLEVTWQKQLLSSPGSVPLSHLLPVDTSLHWAYSLYGYEGNSIAADGVPVVTHVHGGHNDSPFNGNPEYFFSPNFGVKGPRWMSRKYSYGDPDLNEDGSVDIYFGPKAPEGKEKNWIQTVPGKSWFVFF